MVQKNNEYESLKEYIKDCITGVNGRIDSKFDLLHIQVENINKHLERQNGRIGKAEQVIVDCITDKEKEKVSHHKDIQNRVYTCPQLPLLHELKQENITKKEIKKYMISTVVITSLVVGIIVGVSKIITF